MYLILKLYTPKQITLVDESETISNQMESTIDE
jgi:hypothetical protein